MKNKMHVKITRVNSKTEASVYIDDVYYTGFNYLSEDYANMEADKCRNKLVEEYKQKGYTVS